MGDSEAGHYGEEVADEPEFPDISGDRFLPDETDALPASLRYNNFDLLCTIISIITYLFDLVMDIIVAVYFYHLGVSHGIYHYWYFGLTVTFVILPSLTMTGFSFRWYLMDAENSEMPSVPLWRWILRLVVLLLQIAPVLRYIDSMRYGIQSRLAGHEEARAVDPVEKKKARQKRIDYYTLMVFEDADATLLRLFECFMESAPQLVLQIYILIRDPGSMRLDDEAPGNVFIKTSILVVSVVSSLFSLAWSLVVYHRSLRYTLPDKKNLNWSGSVMQFLWHFLSITARVIALSLFASIYPKWIGPVCAAHWVIMSTWVMLQNTQACNTKCGEVLFSLVLGAIYVFSFFNAKDARTRYKYLIYYTFCFCENTALIVVWFLYANEDVQKVHPGYVHWYYYPGIFGHYLAFFASLFFMVLYYAYFHPTGIVVDVGPLNSFRLSKAGNTAAGIRTDRRAASLDNLGNEAEMKPLSRPTMSSPALDEADVVPSVAVRTFGVKRPAGLASQKYIEKAKPRSWKAMAHKETTNQ